jgi:hypothetical protein
MRTIVTALSAAALLAQTGVAARQPRFERVYPLKAEEGVFAYARVAPSGQLLAYASEMPAPGRSNAITQTVTVVDLAAKKTLFTEPGIDAYWSNDSSRMIFLSFADPRGSSVVIRHHPGGEIARNVAPVSLGDYFSWAVRDGRDLILTIQSNYYFLDGDKGVMPAQRPPSCPGIGVGQRPLISKDGRRASTFVGGTVVLRNLTDCDDIVDTGLQGAKADWSFDGRYVAFHVAKLDRKGYDLVVVDAERRTQRRITASMAGSSLFPSWTKDGRLCFRYDGDDYRGFMMATDVLSVPEQPLPPAGRRVPATLRWTELFPETAAPASRVVLAMIWATWSAHSPYALEHLQAAADDFRARGIDASAVTAVELSSLRADVDRLRRQGHVHLPEIPLAADRLPLTQALNQIPTTLLFKDGLLLDSRLGAQSSAELRDWVAQALR